MTREARYVDSERIRRYVMNRVRLGDGTGCWNWDLALTVRGYARARVNGVNIFVHRLSYLAFVGPIPEGTQIDHLCRNKGCVNPEHLEPVTGAENMRRAFPLTPISCPKGHPRNEANTGIGRTGKRHCRPCMREGRARDRAAGPPVDVKHGSRLTYGRYRCRCEPCVEVARAYDRALYARRTKAAVSS